MDEFKGHQKHAQLHTWQHNKLFQCVCVEGGGGGGGGGGKGGLHADLVKDGKSHRYRNKEREREMNMRIPFPWQYISKATHEILIDLHFTGEQLAMPFSTTQQRRRDGAS